MQRMLKKERFCLRKYKMKKCLIVIDMQYEFKDGCLSCGMVDNDFILRVKDLIEHCRKQNIEVIMTFSKIIELIVLRRKSTTFTVFDNNISLSTKSIEEIISRFSCFVYSSGLIGITIFSVVTKPIIFVFAMFCTNPSYTHVGICLFFKNK